MPNRDPVENRKNSLTAYHTRDYNERRWRRGAPALLERAFRRAVSRAHPEQVRLQNAAKEVVRRFNNRIRGKLVRRLRRYFEKAVAAGSKSARARSLLGCTVEEFRAHLEKQFQPGMSWANHRYDGWHIDHIRPLSSFDLRDPEQLQEAFHFSNMQPLWGIENLAKGNKVVAST